MFPTLGHLLSYLTGSDIALGFPTFGLLVALSFIAAAMVMAREMKRKEGIGLFHPFPETVTTGTQPGIWDFLGNALFGFVLGYKIVYAFLNKDLFLHNPADVIISLEGNVLGGIVFGIALGAWSYYQKKKKALPQPETKTVQVHPYELVPNITIVAAISGILGAKLFHNLEYWEDFMADPIGGLTSFSGLTFYGGLIFGTVAVVWYVRRKGINPLSVADSLAPGLILAYALGRMGCQLSGDGDWGINNTAPKPGWLSWLPDWMWSFTYPHNVAGDGQPIPGCVGEYCNELVTPVWPTPIYETIMGLLIFAILWSIRKKVDKPGMMISIYLIFNGIERFLIEQIRVNAEYNILGGITQAEIISSVLIVLGIAGTWYFAKKKPQLG